MKKALLLLAAIVLTIPALMAQSKTVSGRVTAQDSPDGLPGVNILVKGTSIGSVTDLDGYYSFQVPEESVTLVFSYIGYLNKEVAYTGQSQLDVLLVSDLTALTEFVVTAQGLERDERSLGYSLQSVKGDALAQRSEPNVLNALQGKVAGVTIGSASGAAGASTNINIRGITSFSGSNQPLIVLDGIILSNDTDNTQNTLFGSQPANRLNDIAPETIESINILKGPAASVLYGSRASAGAIIITTKSGKGLNDKTAVTVTSSVNFQDPIPFANLQNNYGQGTFGNFVPTSSFSWGPRFGTPGFETVTNTQGKEVPYKAYPDHFDLFFKTGRILQNGVSLASGNRDENFILSLSSTNQDGIIPGSLFDRYSVQLAGNKKLQNGIKVGGTLTYVNSTQSNTTMGNGGSALGQITRIPRSFDFSAPYEDPIRKRSIYYNPTQNHPLWSIENEYLTSKVDRLFGGFNIGYDFADWLNISYRITGDTYTDRRKLLLRPGSVRTPQGQIDEDMVYRSELNGDLLINMRKQNLFGSGVNATLLLGQNINQRDFQNMTVSSLDFVLPGFDHVDNGNVFNNSTETSNRRRLMGHYAQLALDYKEYLFLELSGRVDQSSTLPKGNNSYFYPSAAMSFVLTDAFNITSDKLSYLKLRASAAQVGRDADPYLLQTTFGTTTLGNNVAQIRFPFAVGGENIPGFNVGGRIGSANLTPEFVTSYEGGINLGLFQNRIGLDLAYFNTVSTNQIFNVAVSPSSGFDTRTTNIGKMTNKGIEAVLSATVLDRGNFSWDVNLNFTRIRNKVVSISEGVENSVITGNNFVGISPSIAVGQPYGVIIASAFPRNKNGELLINPATGTFFPGVGGQIVANVQPDWLGGLNNTFHFKNFSLSALIDVRYGGEIFSFSQADLKTGGHIDYTGVDRHLPRVLPGVIDNGDGTYSKNYIQIPAQDYFTALGGLGSEGAVFDATVYRLRELAMSYNFPRKWLNQTPFGQASIGVSARNLFFFAPGFPTDPELNTRGAGNIQGMDLNGAPQTRNYGFNIRFTL
ncbi:SusC/RagA family TonB-linked outer membrane protein [Shivajiella indica]|uniref:SusC/RagA family TonB-linked outer membrane protein n=1 Tax=Shivajiella indica TaxID=872115 RepID=A0ABW5B865_9BACT